MINFFKRLFKGNANYWQDKAQDYAGTIEMIYIELGAMIAERESELNDPFKRATLGDERLLAKYHQAYDTEERIENLLKKEGIDINNFRY